MDSPNTNNKKNNKRIEDIVKEEEELLAVLQGHVLVGREQRGAEASVVPICRREDQRPNPFGLSGCQIVRLVVWLSLLAHIPSKATWVS